MGCSRTQKRHESVNAHQESKWDNRAVSVVEKQQQAAVETKRVVKRTTRTVVKKPDGTVSDTTVVEDSSTDQASRSASAETDSRSAQATGVTKRDVQASSSSVSSTKPAGFPVPLWMIAGLLAALLFIAWRAGWRPWRR